MSESESAPDRKANTYHRAATRWAGGSKYVAHIYAQNFQKDQVLDFCGGGHRHEIEYAVAWVKNGKITHLSTSSHGELVTIPASKVAFDENGHPKVVYHKEGAGAHALRPAGTNGRAENETGALVTAPLLERKRTEFDQMSNAQFRQTSNETDFGAATVVFNDENFLWELTKGTPDSYPDFCTDRSPGR